MLIVNNIEQRNTLNFKLFERKVYCLFLAWKNCIGKILYVNISCRRDNITKEKNR